MSSRISNNALPGAENVEENVASAKPGEDDASEFSRRACDSRTAGSGKFSLIRAFRCAGCGVAYGFSTQRNLKIQLVLAAIAVGAGFALAIPRSDWIAIVLCIMAVMVAELINTALESVVDVVSPQWSALAGVAKDTAAGAVLLASLGSVVIAALIFIPALVARLAG